MVIRHKTLLPTPMNMMDKHKSHNSAGSTPKGNLSVDASTVGAQYLQAPIYATRPRQTKLDIEFTVKPRSTLTNSNTSEVVEIVDDKFEKQRRAMEKNNRTMVKPRLNLIQIEDKPIKNKVLRGNKRTETHLFFKELVNSNKVNVTWPIIEPEAANLEAFWKRRDATKRNKFVSNNELFAHLSVFGEKEEPSLMVPDEKRLPQNETMVESDKQDSTTSVTRDIALMDKIDQLLASMSRLEARCEKQEVLIKELQNENQCLKQLVNKLETVSTNETPEFEKKSMNKTSKVDKTKKKSAIENDVVQSKVQTVSKKGKKVLNAIKRTVRVVKGYEQSEEVVDTCTIKAFTPSPTKPKALNVKDSQSTKISKLRQWYHFDKNKIAEHQKQVLESVCTDKSFSQVLRDNGIPKQKIRYIYKPKTVVDETLYPKPGGIPFKKWKEWINLGDIAKAYRLAEKFLYLMFKKEMYIFRQRWLTHTKEFNPYLSEPKLVWDTEVTNYADNRDTPITFINSWRTLVKTYKPVKPINEDWYHAAKQNV